MSDEMCRHCGGQDGAHGLVHVRHGNGGGNKPCPATTESEKAKCICDGFSFGQPTHPFIVNAQCLVHGVSADSGEAGG